MASITSRSGRLKLGAAKEPYWRTLRRGVSLGYRRPRSGVGSWVGRFAYVNADGKSRNLQHVLGLADDIEGEGLDYAAAMEHCLGMAYIHGPAPRLDHADYTVEQASKDYLKELKRQGRKATALHDAELTINAHILPALGTVQVRDLTTRDLKRWRDALLVVRARPSTVSGDTVGKRAGKDEIKRGDRKRKRATVNRIWTTLRALLSLAFQNEPGLSDEAWRRVKPFKGANVPRQQFLTVAEAKALIAACKPPFADLVRAGLATGCRLGELLALKARDFNQAQGSLHIAQSKSGHPRDVILADDGRTLFARLTEAKEEEAALLFPGWTGKAHVRPMRRAVTAAGLGSAVTFHTLRHTWASHAVMNGMPLLVVARNLGHRDTRMVEQVYGHLAKSFLIDAVRDHAPRFTLD